MSKLKTKQNQNGYLRQVIKVVFFVFPSESLMQAVCFCYYSWIIGILAIVELPFKQLQTNFNYVINECSVIQSLSMINCPEKFDSHESKVFFCDLGF